MQKCLDYPTYESQAAMKPGQRAQLHSTPRYNLESPIESVAGQIEKCDSQCTSPNLPLPLPTFFQEEFEISNHVKEICGRNAQTAYQLHINLELSEFVFPINLNTNVTGEIKQNLFLQPLLKKFREWKTTSMKNFRFSEQTVLPPSLSFKENLDRFDLYRFVFLKRNAAPFYKHWNKQWISLSLRIN